MGSPNIKDLLTSFSPSSDFFAISSGDGRIKVWDAVKGQLQTEFSSIAPPGASPMLAEAERGHLSLDYTCVVWVKPDPEKKKKKKKRRSAGGSLLVLGTGTGDVLALDVAAGQLRWKVADCHPGGVSAVSSAEHGLCVYTAGVDGMVCQIDSLTGSLVSKFRSSTKAISSLSISADGKILATASAQLKVFNCADNKKIQKFSGHSMAVRCMIFSEDGRYILSSAVGERYIAIWRIDGGRKQPASCVLSMEHPAIFLDSKGSDAEGTECTGLYVLAISEMGLCYFWHGNSIEDLRDCVPTKISVSVESSSLKSNKNLAVFAAKFHDIIKPASGLVVVAYGSLVKPSFEKLTVQLSIDMTLNASQDGILLPVGQFQIPHKGQAVQTKVTALDRANAEDAVLPIPKLYVQGKKRKHSMPHSSADIKNSVVDPDINTNNITCLPDKIVNSQRMQEDGITSIEDKLRAVGILGRTDNINSEDYNRSPTKSSSTNTLYNSVCLLINSNMPAKKIRAHILSLTSSDAYKFMEILVCVWKTRHASSKNVLPWLYGILVNHSHFIISQESSAQMLDGLRKMTRSKSAAVQPLLRLSGRVQLIMTQIEKAGQDMDHPLLGVHRDDESEDEDDDQDINELFYGGEENGSQSGSDDEELQE